MTSSRQDAGQAGEALAAAFVRRLGWQILERNYRTRFGEVDLIARDGRVVAFVEVRAKGSGSFGTPAESVTARKQQHLIKSALVYLRALRDPGLQPRFDLIAVALDEQGKPQRCELLKNAFECNLPYLY
ncbi:MAG: YraN family protein [Candidatus Omnitrophica bacterium]|nr:YraN family protein [Candidatus Omnitrophota bacterium]